MLNSHWCGPGLIPDVVSYVGEFAADSRPFKITPKGFL